MHAIIIRKGKFFNYTYSSVRFGPYGNPTLWPIFVCDEWPQGFQAAKNKGVRQALFLDSGTVFYDIEKFMDQLKNYPHQGLIGHIIDPRDPLQYYSLHPQAFFLTLDQFDNEDFNRADIEAPAVVRSSMNIHDDYTPLWIKPGSTRVKCSGGNFGQTLLARQLNRGLSVSNWHQKLRDNKVYLYRNEIRDLWLQDQSAYINMAQQQLWITNNSPLPQLHKVDHLIAPASGLYWIMMLLTNNIQTANLVDISSSQCNLARALLDQWDGNRYSEFVFQFIKDNNSQHLQFEQPLTPLERLQLRSSKFFCERVDQLFDQCLSDFKMDSTEFVRRWNQLDPKRVYIHNQNLVDYINQHPSLDPTYYVWISNILDYKYTWLKNTAEEISQFEEKIAQSGARVST